MSKASIGIINRDIKSLESRKQFLETLIAEDNS